MFSTRCRIYLRHGLPCNNHRFLRAITVRGNLLYGGIPKVTFDFRKWNRGFPLLFDHFDLAGGCQLTKLGAADFYGPHEFDRGKIVCRWRSSFVQRCLEGVQRFQDLELGGFNDIKVGLGNQDKEVTFSSRFILHDFL